MKSIKLNQRGRGKQPQRQKYMREIELSRRLADLLKAMPYEIFLLFQNALLNNLDVAHGVEELSREIQLEAPIQDGNIGDKRRLDVLVPCAISFQEVFNFKEIIFELKLDEENLEQVEGYATSRPNALVVSLAKKLVSERSKIGNVAGVTWEQFFWGLTPLLTLDGQLRVLEGRLLQDIERRSDAFFIELPDTPKPLGELFNRYLEDFLYEIKRYVRFTERRVMVVTGEKATRTTKDGKIYFCPSNWDADFDYLVVVHQRKVQFVGQVKYKLHPIIYGENKPVNLGQVLDVSTNQLVELPKDRSEALYNYVGTYEHNEDGLVVWLDEVNSGADGLDSNMINKEYAKKGAITQSHRYFKDPKAFLEHFNEK